MTKSNRQHICYLANWIMEEGYAYDMSEAFRFAWKGGNERYYFGEIDGHFRAEKR